jgi:5-formyltetrahydrofolate cyclo-ligase
MTNKVNVGYGKGFYDKFLAECSPATVIDFFFEAEELIDIIKMTSK